MRFLFFDIECANCFNGSGKICEFGYVVTDERFCVLDKQLFIIDPRAEFDRYVAKNLLAYSVEKYRAAQDYRHYYNRIAALFADGDMLVLGHSTENDIKYLNDEAKRYGRPFFNVDFYDAKVLYSAFAGTPERFLSVPKICNELGITAPEHEHKSVDDAYATMLIVKEICAKSGVSLVELIERCEDCRGSARNGKITTALGEKAKARRAARGKSRKRLRVKHSPA